MKKILNNKFTLIAAWMSLNVFLNACNDTQQKQDTDNAALLVEQPHFNCGKVSKQNRDSIDFKFTLKNISKDSIIIDNVDVTCGCLSVHSAPKMILPGKTEYIKGKIGIRQQIGNVNKTIFVNYNNDEVTILRVKGKVIE